tara:strand:+ start:2455 stop:2922 length:468 start_codon:yes stop_codon:yes gene_type:complete
MSDTETTTVRQTGCVKWFNNSAGFGFITTVDGDNKGDDVFVHHTGLTVSSEQYKYLVTGEYVTFSLSKSDNTEHPFQADDVRGICNGKLMCETRNEMRQQREEHASEQDDRQRSHNRYGGGGPRGNRDRGGRGGRGYRDNRRRDGDDRRRGSWSQ